MEQRDTQQTNTDSNGQSYTGQAENNLYRKHSTMSFIAKKTEKITTAIYMVTDFIHESEPLRYALRTLSLTLLSSTQKLSSRSSEPHYVLADEIQRTIEEAKVLITLATTIGLISDMNGAVLVNELEKVQSTIKTEYGEKKVLVATHPGYANIVLNPAMFEVNTSPVLFEKSFKGHDVSNGQTENKDVFNKRPRVSTFKNESFSKKSDIGNKIARRNDVLNIVRNKIKVSIKDIASILKDTSEKTIQRELLALVKEGVLVKEGEKRWSTYRIAS